MNIITCTHQSRCSMNETLLELLLYKNQLINLQFKSMDWFLYNGHTGRKWDKMDIPNKKKNP